MARYGAYCARPDAEPEAQRVHRSGPCGWGIDLENRGAPHRAERAGRGGGLRLAAGAEHDPV